MRFIGYSVIRFDTYFEKKAQAFFFVRSETNLEESRPRRRASLRRHRFTDLIRLAPLDRNRLDRLVYKGGKKGHGLTAMEGYPVGGQDFSFQGKSTVQLEQFDHQPAFMDRANKALFEDAYAGNNDNCSPGQ